MKLFLIVHEVTDNEWETVSERQQFVSGPDFRTVAGKVMAEMAGLEHCERLIAIVEKGAIASQY